jgi:hypothetical protein
VSLKLSKLLIIVSTAIIVATVVAVLFSYQNLHQFCICIANKLAYSWILLAVTVLLSLISMLLTENDSEGRISKTKKQILWFLALLQSASFMTGLIFLVYFAAKIIDVI